MGNCWQTVGLMNPTSSKTGDEWGTSGNVLFLDFPPDVFEVEEALFVGDPLGRAHGAFGEATAGLGIVAQIDGVSRRLEHYLMHSDHFALAERCDFDFDL